MKNYLLILGLVITVWSTNYTGHINAVFYDFKNFTMLDLRSFLSAVDYHPTLSLLFHVTDFVYNIGIPTKTQCDQEAIACIQYKGDPTYYSISTAQTWSSKNTDNNISFLSNTTMQFTLPRLNKTIGPKNEKPQLIMMFTCSILLNFSTLTYTAPYYYLKIFNSSACQINFGKITDLLYSYRYILGPVAIILGLILGLAGLRFFKYTLFTLGFLVAFSICISLIPYCFAMNDYFSNQQKLITFVISIVVGVIIGGLSVFCAKLGIFLLGACLGVTGFTLVYISVLFGIPEMYYYLGCLVCAIICAVLAFRLFDHMVILSTSIIGSFLFIRGSSVFIGGFPNVFVLYNMIESGIGFDSTFYAYLAGIIILSILSFLYQEKYRKDNKETYEQDTKDLGLTNGRYIFVYNSN